MAPVLDRPNLNSLLASQSSLEAPIEWPLQDAKNRLSKVVKDAREHGPQTITDRGKRTAVILSAEDYDSLNAAKPTFVDALLSGPAWDDEFVEAVNTRSKEPGRDIDF